MMLRCSLVLCLLVLPAVLCQRETGENAPDERPRPGDGEMTEEDLANKCPRPGRYSDSSKCPDSCTDGGGECESGKSCCENQNCGGSVCEPDMTRCSSSTDFLATVLSNTTCLQDFTMALAETEDLSEYCRLFVIGAQCIAEHLSGQMYKGQCMARMVYFLESNADEIFALLDTYGIQHERSITEQSATCFAAPAEQCSQNPCRNNGQCIEVDDQQTCNCSNSRFGGETCSKEVGVELMSDYKIKFEMEAASMPVVEVSHLIVGFRTKKKQGIIAQLTNAAFTQSMTLSMNNNGGVKFTVDDSINAWQINSDVAMDLSDDRPHTVMIRTSEGVVTLKVDGSPEIVYSGDMSTMTDTFAYLYIGNNDTSTSGFEGCIHGMELNRMFPLKALFKDPRPEFIKTSPDELKESTCGFRQVDETWNTPCPDMSDQETEMCPQQCTTADQCSNTGDVCCNVNGDQCHLCIPDMTQCVETSVIKMKIGSCSEYRNIFESKNQEDFCSSFWSALECISREIATDTYHQMCLMRMAMFMRGAPLDVLKALAEQADIKIPEQLMKFAAKALKCKESPAYKAPVRPIPEEVKSCSDVSVITTTGRTCGQGRVSSQSSSNQACMKLKELVNCVASKIYPDEESNTIKRKQCASQIKEVISDFYQRLKIIFPVLERIDVASCEVKESVCGGDVRPLDGVDCTIMRCQANYTCISGHCCPAKKMGQCPKPVGNPLCTSMKCSQDHECGETQKCCDVGCGSHTCIEMITKEPSKCRVQMMAAKRQLEMSGICGSGQAVLKVPRCVGDSFNPIQGDIQNGLYYCVDEDGNKIAGSDFTGNRDCTKVRPGVCPTKPSVCLNTDTIIKSCDDDFECTEPNHKCCHTSESDVCVRKCLPANNAPEEVHDDCPNRQCCQITMCLGRVCPKDKTAVCRIDSCGTCDVKFYTNSNMTIDDCEDGLTQCQKERTRAEHKNNQQDQQTDQEKLKKFLTSGDRRDDDDEKNGQERNMGRSMGGDDDDDDDDDDKGKDEYGEEREKAKTDSEDDEEDDFHTAADLASAMDRICLLIDRLRFCKNGSTCAFGSGESDFELCKCEKGMIGVQCDRQMPAVFVDTPCVRDTERLNDMKEIMDDLTREREQMVFHEIFNRFRKHMPLLPVMDCGPSGDYNQTLRGRFLPLAKDDKHDIYFCADTQTGSRVLYTPVTMVSSNQLPDCEKVSYENPDILAVKRRCIMPARLCGADEESCEETMFYWNQETGECEMGKTGYGFLTATECYDSCDVKAVCEDSDENTDSWCDDLVFWDDAKPCSGMGCDYHYQFCNVMVHDDGTQTGECKDFPEYCLLEYDPGYSTSDTSDRKSAIKAFYFDATNRQCVQFGYLGKGGNKNRFYDINQCHTECSTRQYKFDDIVCPIPDVLMRQRFATGCDDDLSCEGEQVCCYRSKNQRVCTQPFGSCSSGERCSLYGACEDDTCVCPECPDVEDAPVCGSDSETYMSACHLKQHACKTHQPLTVLLDGACTVVDCSDGGPQFCIEIYQPVCAKGVNTGVLRTFSNDCKMNVASCGGIETYVKYKDGTCAPEGDSQCLLACTREYKPMCVYYKDPIKQQYVTETYNNKCLMTQAMVCQDLHLEVLYQRPCNTPCGGENGPTCSLYEECIDGECACPTVCTKEYNPVCAHPWGNDGNLEEFDNPCMLSVHQCKEQRIYVIKKDVACKAPEPVLECPKFPANIIGSAEYLCNDETNSFCDRKTQTCCPYGAGRRCVDNKHMIRKVVKKPGVCPRMSNYNTNREQCEHRCKDDADCAGHAKCCKNTQCEYSTCAVPYLPSTETPCSSQQTLLEDVACSTDAECPQGGTCKHITYTDGVNNGVCCMTTSRALPDKTEMMELALCKALSKVGIGCGEHGICSANLTSFQLCQCNADSGNYGYFCDRPPIHADDANCQEGIFNCVYDPCTIEVCEAFPTATCKDSYCGGCNAVYTYKDRDVTSQCKETVCLRQQTLYRKIYQTVQEYMGGKRGDAFDDDVEENDDDDDMWTEEENMVTDELLETVMAVLGRLPNFHGLPVDGELQCNKTGYFEPIQCVHRDTRTQVCYCVDTVTGAPIPHTAKRASADQLDCSVYTEGILSEECFDDIPSQEDDVCDKASSVRYFFNNATNECEGFDDTGCSESKNSFNSYKTCRKYCPAQTTTASPCAAVRCGNNQHCRILNGQAMCDDPKEVREFEPVCEKDGKYSPKQCNADACKCVNTDTGEDIDGSVTTEGELECKIVDGTVKAEKRRDENCEDGSKPEFCGNGADSCQGCEMQGGDSTGDRPGQGDETGGRPDQEVDDGTCSSCDSCPGNSRKKVCDVVCAQTCNSFPTANCEVNKCTCKEEWKALGVVIDCNKVQPNCKRAKHLLETEARKGRVINGENTEVVMINCTQNGAYENMCRGDKCWCLDATSGQPVGSSVSREDLKCDAVQWKTLGRKMKSKLTLTTKAFSSFTSNQLNKMKQKVVELFEKYGMLAEVVLREGSVVAEVESKCLETEGCELSSSNDALVANVNKGDETLEVDGQVLIPTNAAITGTITAEELFGPITEPTPEEEDDNKTTIIIVVVVVAVVAILVIAVAVYCYTKANRKQKNHEVQFSDLRGQENPTYKS